MRLQEELDEIRTGRERALLTQRELHASELSEMTAQLTRMESSTGDQEAAYTRMIQEQAASRGRISELEEVVDEWRARHRRAEKDGVEMKEEIMQLEEGKKRLREMITHNETMLVEEKVKSEALEVRCRRLEREGEELNGVIQRQEADATEVEAMFKEKLGSLFRESEELRG